MNLLEAEEKMQRRDIADLSALVSCEGAHIAELRHRSAALGRKWLALAVERFG